MIKTMNKYFYSVGDKDFNDAFEIEVKYQYIDYSVEDVAEEAAEDYYDNHDGWEATWPQTIHVWNDKEEYLGAADVHVEYQSSFYGYPLEKKIG